MKFFKTSDVLLDVGRPERYFMFNNDYYYHIYNRGVEKREVFMDKSDYLRFLKSMAEFNRLEPVGSLYDLGIKRSNRYIAVRPLGDVPGGSTAGGALVNIICYCLNPNHYHLLIRQLRDGGIAEFIKRLSVGYTCYFNNKYNRSGALFQGKYKRKEIKTEGGFTKLTVYINCNAEIHGIGTKEDWPWSSYKNYIKKTFDVSKDVERLNQQEFKNLCEELLPEIKQVKNLEKYGLE